MLNLSMSYCCLFPWMFNHGNSQQCGSCMWFWRKAQTCAFESVNMSSHWGALWQNSTESVLEVWVPLSGHIVWNILPAFWWKSGSAVIFFFSECLFYWVKEHAVWWNLFSGEWNQRWTMLFSVGSNLRHKCPTFLTGVIKTPQITPVSPMIQHSPGWYLQSKICYPHVRFM